jgi:signal peptidase
MMRLSGLWKIIDQFRTSSHPLVSLLRDLAWVVVVVGGIALSLYLICGTWPAVVTVESESMVPHMNVGDLVLVVKENRFGPLQTWETGRQSDYRAFEDYGDVIIYKPNGGNSVHPIIHRAMVWLNEDQVKQYYPNIPPHSG